MADDDNGADGERRERAARPRSLLVTAGMVGGLGVQLTTLVVGGGLLGHWADERWASSPWGVMLGLALGIAAAVVSVWRVGRLLAR